MHNKLTSHEFYCIGAHSAANASCWTRHQGPCHPWPELQLDLPQSKRQQSMLITSNTTSHEFRPHGQRLGDGLGLLHGQHIGDDKFRICGRGAVEDLLHQGANGLHIAAVREFELTRLLSQMLSASGSLYRNLRSHTR